MRNSRSLIAAASALLWPTVILVPLGITFGAPRVYAESAPAFDAAPPKCTEQVFARCADASPMQACECSGLACACTTRQCVGGSAPSALACGSIATCSSLLIDACAGKAKGTSCLLTLDRLSAEGTCEGLDTCLSEDDAGLYTPGRPIGCVDKSTGTGGSGGAGGGMGGGATQTGNGHTGGCGPARDAGASPATSGDDSGCALFPGPLGDSGYLMIPLGVIVAFAFRRRR